MRRRDVGKEPQIDTLSARFVPSSQERVAFVWSSEFETGIARVDDQHRGLVDIINALGDYLSSGYAPDDLAVRELFLRLEDYASLHFNEEEGMMEGIGVAESYMERHRMEHRFYIAELQRLRANVGQSVAATQSVLRFLTAWLSHHILGIDQSGARQVARILEGVTPEDALAAETEPQSGATGPLLNALHVLFQEVAERNKSLRVLNATLEQRVEQRTAELTQIVEDLAREMRESQRLSNQLEIANRHLEEVAMTDALTGLPNRRHAMAQLLRAWQESTQNQLGMAVIMVDADGFKTVNDTFGHDAGDRVLVALGKELRNAVRTDDMVCRMGGDEFLIICPDTALQGATKVAVDTWKRVSEMHVTVGSGEWRGSISVGVAARHHDIQSVAQLIKAADDAVYGAKNAGRNQVVADRPPRTHAETPGD